MASPTATITNEELVDATTASPKLDTLTRASSDDSKPFDERLADGTSPPTQQRRDDDLQSSIDLARQLQAEEAMASYHHHVQYLRENSDQMDPADYAALQSALEEERLDEQATDYDDLLQMGETIGDVKAERWAMKAKKEIQKLPKFQFDPSQSNDQDDVSSSKCLICMHDYEASDPLRKLPCGHCYHVDCVDNWLSTKDFCPLCRQPIVVEH